jgi:hypothetical protein
MGRLEIPNSGIADVQSGAAGLNVPSIATENSASNLLGIHL